MNKFFLLLLLWPSIVVGQRNEGFEFGKISQADLSVNTYGKDTSAMAVVLGEFGEAYIDNDDDHNLLLEYHIKIKILKKGGVEKANFAIPLYKQGATKQTINSVKASTFNLNGNVVTESKMEHDAVFSENKNEYWDIYKFTLPDVQAGSIIEVKYQIESPFIFNFWPWKFQSDIPKVKSEFWARIPGNYIYNISLQGFLRLSKEESTILKSCFTPGGGAKADCALYKYAIYDVPAFVEEEYMTSKENFVSAVNFELSQVRHFDGRIDNYTRTWPDVDDELRIHGDFGQQVKKASNLLEEKVKELAVQHTDPLEKAQAIYRFVQDGYVWNGNYGKYTELGVKKAFDTRKGNAGDLNLTLVGALKAAGFNADPVILATRDQKEPNHLHPVMSDFNYVVAGLNLGPTRYLLDATDGFLPFGMLPERCLNGKGRLISNDEKETGWVDTKPKEKRKKQVTMNLKLDDQGAMQGEVFITSYGYEAFDVRKQLASNEKKEERMRMLRNKLPGFAVSGYAVENPTDISQPLVEEMKIELEEAVSAPTLFINPFMLGDWDFNPLHSKERSYPVDFGAPLETNLVFTLRYTNRYVVDELPASTAITLPQNTGRLLMNGVNADNKISLSNIISFTKSQYGSDEYAALRELFDRLVQLHQANVVLKVK